MKLHQEKIHGVAQETDSLFSIVKNEQIVGVIDLHFIDMKNKKAEIGYWLHSKYQHQGIMTKAVRKVCEYAFDNLGLNKLSIFADVKNIGSNLVAKHAEFSFVTIHKEYYFHGEQFCDMNEYSLLKRHFRK
ncbi:GNAT family N-acetyltransferase [Leuconostoc litchii]|uniref:GNAT family N-acetyltransferase n=1 Tax=Leuconostoc litchii TaxID=1981069 RepID=UPI0032AFEBA7